MDRAMVTNWYGAPSPRTGSDDGWLAVLRRRFDEPGQVERLAAIRAMLPEAPLVTVRVTAEDLLQRTGLRASTRWCDLVMSLDVEGIGLWQDATQAPGWRLPWTDLRLLAPRTVTVQDKSDSEQLRLDYVHQGSARAWTVEPRGVDEWLSPLTRQEVVDLVALMHDVARRAAEVRGTPLWGTP